MPKSPVQKPEVKTTKKAVFNLSFMGPLTSENKVESVIRVVEPLLALNFNIDVLAEGEEVYQKELFKLSESAPENLSVLEAVPQNKERIYTNPQVAVFMIKPELKDLKLLAKNNVITVVPSKDLPEGLVNFDAQKEVGNCFIYDADNFWDFLATILRAYETFKFPYDWSQCKKSFKKLLEI